VSGYPDSHLQPAATTGGGRGLRRRLLPLVPILALAAWFAYLWAVSGVIPSVERYADGRLKAEGFVKRTGWGTYQRHGRWVTYYPGGARASEGFYELGRKAGTWSYWDEDGRPAGPGQAPAGEPEKPAR
jgi:hypothetical protein